MGGGNTLKSIDRYLSGEEGGTRVLIEYRVLGTIRQGTIFLTNSHFGHLAGL